MQIKIHLLMNQKFLGDKNQALGIKNMLEKQFILYDTEIKEWNDEVNEELSNLKKELDRDQQSQHILICIGEHGLQALQRFKNIPKNVTTLYASHQIPSGLINTLDNIHILALPTHVVSNQIYQEISKHKHIHFIQTIGVSHNLSKSALEKSYLNWQSQSENPIQSSHQFIGVILGGDAPEPNGKMRYFTPREAKSLANFLTQLSNQYSKVTLLVTNSPRTGKFDSETKLEQKVHTGERLDETTKALIEQLQLNQVKFQFFDFVIGKPSAYQPILWALQQQNSIAVITGDSTSMITEMIDLLNEKSLYIVNIESMNASHVAHVQSVNQAGQAHVITMKSDKEFTWEFAPKLSQLQNKKTVAEIIALEVGNYLKEKNNHLFYNNQSKNTLSYEKYLSNVGLLFTCHKKDKEINLLTNKYQR